MILTTVSGQQYTLRLGENVVGRGSECDLRINSEQISRRHVVIHWDGQQARISDVGSTNGTRLNDQRLAAQQSYALNPGDRLELGGPDGRLELRPSTAVYTEPLLQEAAEPVRPAAGRLPAWLYAIAGLAVLLLVVAIVLLATGGRTPEKASAPTPAQTPAAPAQAVVVTQAAAALKALLPSTTPLVQAPKVEVGKVGSETGGTAPQPQAPAALSPGQIPPINPTTMPDLVNSLVKEFVPGEMLQPLGTMMPGLTGGTSMPGLPGGGAAPALPVGPKRYGAPTLRAPGDGASFKGENANVILEWEPIGNLGAKDYYRVVLYYKKDGREQAGGAWLKATSYRVPVWFLQQQSGRFDWQVVISEASDLPEQGGKLGATVSDPSARRWFTWTWESGGPGPTPTPSFQG